jgi:hypothetical protein
VALITTRASSVTDQRVKPSSTQKGQAPCLQPSTCYDPRSILPPRKTISLSKSSTGSSRKAIRSFPGRRSRKRKRPSMARSSPNAPTATASRTSPSKQSDAHPQPQSRTYYGPNLHPLWPKRPADRKIRGVATHADDSLPAFQMPPADEE